MTKTDEIILELTISNYFDFGPFVFSVLPELMAKPDDRVAVYGGVPHPGLSRFV